MNYESINAIATIAQTIFGFIGIFAAGLWTYYLFHKNRIVADSITMNIELKSFTSSLNTAIIRLSMLNVGKTKLSNISGKMEFYYCFNNNDNFLLFPLRTVEDLFIFYNSDKIELEPGMNMNIDIPLSVPFPKETHILSQATLSISKTKTKSKNYSENALIHIKQ